MYNQYPHQLPFTPSPQSHQTPHSYSYNNQQASTSNQFSPCASPMLNQVTSKPLLQPHNQQQQQPMSHHQTNYQQNHFQIGNMQNNQTHYNNNSLIQYQIQSPPKMQSYQTHNKIMMKQEASEQLNSSQQSKKCSVLN